jgi:hypothetical protein
MIYKCPNNSHQRTPNRLALISNFVLSGSSPLSFIVRRINNIQMSLSFKEIIPTQKTGEEYFHQNGNTIAYNLLQFWRWAGSDLINNTTRGWLAEYIVSIALDSSKEVRLEWAPFDIQFKGYCIEVKSSSYIQSWNQTNISQIRFGIELHRIWNSLTGKYENKSTRSSHIYVFCVFKETDIKKIDPMNLLQWDFYIIPTYKINSSLGKQKTVGLKKLKVLKSVIVSYPEIKNQILKFIESDGVNIRSNFETYFGDISNNGLNRTPSRLA